jgi:hypothetical protein
MANLHEPESIEERNVRALLRSACVPAAPALPASLPERLAARARPANQPQVDLPLAAAVCSVVGVALLGAAAALSTGRSGLRELAAIPAAANILLGPIAALIVIRKLKGGTPHVEA